MDYESVKVVESAVEPGVRYTVSKVSFGRRMELMRDVRDLMRRKDFLSASESAEDKMDAALVQSEIDRLYLRWGLRSVTGLAVDGAQATPEMLIEAGPERLCREALDAVRAEIGLSETETKN